jgi:D-alanine-D-alanine ligase
VSTLSIALIQGGPSTEAEVSRASASGIAEALTRAGHRVTKFELDAQLAECLRVGGFDVVFPIVHGEVGEDGSLQGLLEVLHLPYVGSGVLASALSMDKGTSRVLFHEAGLPCAKGLRLQRQPVSEAAIIARREVGSRIVIKPAHHGSAIGVTRIESTDSLGAVERALATVFAIDDTAIVEHYAKGREATCGVVDLGDGARALPPTEILTPHDAFYTYQARYAPGRSVHECPPRWSRELIVKVQAVAVSAFHALGCRDLARADFIVGDDGDPDCVTLLEVNTLPGFTATSLFPEEAAVSGIPMVDLCDRLARRAHARGASPRQGPLALPT